MLRLRNVFELILGLVLASAAQGAQPWSEIVADAPDTTLTLRLPVETPEVGMQVSAVFCDPLAQDVTSAHLQGKSLVTRMLPNACLQIDSLEIVAAETLTLSFASHHDVSFTWHGAARGTWTATHAWQTANFASGAFAVLTWPTATVMENSHSAIFCSNACNGLKKAKLWMPSMGHGSTPTTTTDLGHGCFQIEKINFLMTDVWEIQMTCGSDDLATFTMDVQ